MQKSLNRVEIKGNVGSDPKITCVESGGVLARFTVATNETIKGKDGQIREETSWHNIAAWSIKGMPDFNIIRKGCYVEIIGRIKYLKYKDKNGDEKNYTEILAQKIIIPITE